MHEVNLCMFPQVSHLIQGKLFLADQYHSGLKQKLNFPAKKLIDGLEPRKCFLKSPDLEDNRL
jgi:hypothetical protein